MRRARFALWVIVAATLSMATYACGDTQTNDASDDGPEAGSTSVGGASGGRGGSAAEGGGPRGGSAGSGSLTGGTNGSGGSGAAAGSNGNGGAAGNGGNGAGGTGAMSGTGGGGGTGGKATQRDMFIMFDRSGSMRTCPDGSTATSSMGCAPTPPTRWDNAAEGLATFFRDPAIAGLRVALRFFPHDLPTPGCDVTSNGCNMEACAAPLVNLAPLTAEPAPEDVHEAALISAVLAADPTLQTMPAETAGPTWAALGGAYVWESNRHIMFPAQETIVVFVTDGLPSGCEDDVEIVVAMAENARALSGVETYVVGLGQLDGAFTDFVHALASAGGTGEALLVADGETASANLAAALHTIHARN